MSGAKPDDPEDDDQPDVDDPSDASGERVPQPKARPYRSPVGEAFQTVERAASLFDARPALDWVNQLARFNTADLSPRIDASAVLGVGALAEAMRPTFDTSAILGATFQNRLWDGIIGMSLWQDEALRVLPMNILGASKALKSLNWYVDSERLFESARLSSGSASPFRITKLMESYAAQTTLSDVATGMLRSNIAAIAATAARIGKLGENDSEESTAFRVGASLLRSFQGFQGDTLGRNSPRRSGINVAASRIATAHFAGVVSILADSDEPADWRKVDDFPTNVYGALGDEANRLGPSLDGADADVAVNALEVTHAAVMTRLGVQVTAYRLQVDVAWKTPRGERLFGATEEDGWWGALIASTIVHDERSFAEYVGWLDRFIVEASSGLKAATFIHPVGDLIVTIKTLRNRYNHNPGRNDPKDEERQLRKRATILDALCGTPFPSTPLDWRQCQKGLLELFVG